jgi:hypothetical protein
MPDESWLVKPVDIGAAALTRSANHQPKTVLTRIHSFW